jgi:hypothetical protein
LLYQFVFWKRGQPMSEHSVLLRHKLGTRDFDRADPISTNLQSSTNPANENYDRAVALAQKLSAQLGEAQERINQLEREAEGLGDQLLAEAKAIIQEVRSNADARVSRAIREADERIGRLNSEAENQIVRLQNELAQATRGIDQVKDEAGTRIESVKMETNARVQAMEAEAKKRVDVIQRENEEKVLRLEADLAEAKDRADRAEQSLMLVRRKIEEHLMPAMRDGPKRTISAAGPRSLKLPMPSRAPAGAWFRRLWLRLTSTAVLGCRIRPDIEPATSSDRAPPHDQGCSNDLNITKTGYANAATAASQAPLPNSGNSTGLSSVTAG